MFVQNITALLISWSKPDGTYESPYKETSSSAGIGSWNFAVATNSLVRVYQKYKTVPGKTQMCGGGFPIECNKEYRQENS